MRSSLRYLFTSSHSVTSSVSSVSIAALYLTCLTAGCTVREPLQVEPFESGVLVFDSRPPANQATGTVGVSFINRQTGLVRYTSPKENILPTDIYNNQNNRPLTEVVRSYAEINGKGFLVLSEQGQIEVVDGSTFRNISLVGGAERARYVIGLNALKGYVSCWGGQTISPTVFVLDVTARQLSKAIPVAAGPEQMVLVNDELFVTNSGGTTEVGKTVSIINTVTDQLVATIPVGDVPTSMVYDAQAGLIYVLCSGRPVGTQANGVTSAELVTINPATRQVTNRVQIGNRNLTANPNTLTFDPQTRTLYFLLRGLIYRTSPTAGSISTDQPLETRTLLTYGFDPVSAQLYGAASNRSAKPGVVLRFWQSGALIDSITTESIPTGFYFK